MKILFIPHGGEHYAPSRLRVYDYIALWRSHGIDCTVIPWSTAVSRSQRQDNFQTLCEIASDYDAVFMQRVLLSNKWMKILRSKAKKIIYDVDDAIYYVPSSQWSSWNYRKLPAVEYLKQSYRYVFRGNRYFSARKKRFDKILTLSDGIVVGNKYIKEYCEKYNENICIAPTPVYVNNILQKRYQNEKKVKIGWVGNRVNLMFVKEISPSLDIVKKKYNNIEIHLITAYKKSDVREKLWKIKPWSIETQSRMIAELDIGIMPLTDDGWARGKCAYKALLYMAAGLPCVVSPVGMNMDVVMEGETGFLAATQKEWVNKLSVLIENIELRRMVGQNARKYVLKYFDISVVFRYLFMFIVNTIKA